MASLTSEQQEAWVYAFEAAKSQGLSAERASEVASDWATETDFGNKPRQVQYELGPKRSQKPSSDIAEKIAAAAHAYDPTLQTAIFSGQENPLGIGNMSRASRARYDRYVAQGIPEETAARMIMAAKHGNSLGRHPWGKAGDFRFENIAGTRLPRNKASQHMSIK